MALVRTVQVAIIEVEPIKEASMKTIGKVLLAVGVGVLMPVLIWVALGVVIQKAITRPRVVVHSKTLAEILVPRDGT